VHELAPGQRRDVVTDLLSHHVGRVGIGNLHPRRLRLDLEDVDQFRTRRDERLEGGAVDDADAERG